MVRKKIACVLGLACLFFSLALPVLACDENHGSKVRIQAPIEAIDCEGTPPTVTLLGLKVDISAIRFNRQWSSAQCEELTCKNLEVGQMVKVELASDIPDPTTGLLTANEFEPLYWFGEATLTVAAPLRGVNGANVTILGLTVDVSSATLLNDEGEPITSDKIVIGQFARLVLDQTKLPALVATLLMVHVDEIKVMAPIQEKDCQGAPSTITLLGLKIDITSIGFQKLLGTIQCEYLTCEDLELGQMVKVKLANDIPDPTTNLFTATELRPRGCCDKPANIIAPLQVIDVSGLEVTVLGMPVDISEAILVDDNEQPITLDKLAVGQFVELDLVSPDAPLAATRLEAQSPISQIEIKFFDKKKRPMKNIKDIKADLIMKGMKRAINVQNAGGGTLLVAGLPQGRAKIAVTCTQDGQTVKGSASVKVKTRSFQQVSLRLRPFK